MPQARCACLAQTAKTPVASVLALAVPALGVAAFRLAAWAQFTSPAAVGVEGFAIVSHAVQLLGMVFALVVNALAPLAGKRLLNAALAAAAFMVFGVAACSVWPNNPTAVLAGGAVTGAASGLVVFAWGVHFCSVEPRASAVELGMGFALYAVLTLVFDILPTGCSQVLHYAAPLVSIACLAWCLGAGGAAAEGPNTGPLRLAHLARVPRGVLAMLGVCMLANMVGKLFIPVSSEPHVSLYRIMWPALFVALFLVIVVWCLVMRRDDPERLMPLFVLVMLSGLLGYPALVGIDAVWAAAYLRATQDCLMLFCWMDTACVAYRCSLPAFAAFGAATLVFVKPPLIVSTALSLALPSAALADDRGFVVLVICVAAFVLVAVAVLCVNLGGVFGAPGAAGAESAEPTGAAAPGLVREAGYARVGSLLQDAYGLTQREAEVALLMARGNTMVQTGERLFITLDTVRAHAKSLYRKLGIHKKQELVDKVDRLLGESEG